jgi:prepilin-type N-terminal cleavage/methylation domain-containing protein
MLKNSKGFTFVELAVAVVVISILITLVSVNWGAMWRNKTDSFLERFSMEVALVREDAVSSYQQRAMELNLTDNAIRIGAIDLVKGFDSFKEVTMPEGFTLKNAIINGRKYSIGKVLIVFYPSGLIDKAILQFEERKEGFSSVVINPLTAKVELFSGYIEEISLSGRANPS